MCSTLSSNPFHSDVTNETISTIEMEMIREKSPEFIPFNQKSFQTTLTNKTNEPIRTATRRRKSSHPCSLSSRFEQSQETQIDHQTNSLDSKRNYLLTEESSSSHPNDENDSKPLNDVEENEILTTIVSVRSTTSKSKRKKFYRCRQCSFVSSIKEDYWKHHRVHIRAEKILQCDLCPFVTKYKHHFDYHLRNHLGSKPFKCSKCDYACINRSMLRSHEKSHLRHSSTDKDDEIQSICDEQTQVDQWQLQNLFPCSHCQMIFKDFILYCTHKHFHHSPDNPFLCSQCGEQKNNSYEFFLHLIEQAHPLP